jgi:hypothetical protein
LIWVMGHYMMNPGGEGAQAHRGPAWKRARSIKVRSAVKYGET